MKKIIVLALILITTISCENDFSTWNIDEKSASQVPAETLFSNAQRNLARHMNKQNVNDNIFNFLAQYWTATTYPSEAAFDLTGRDVPGGFWDVMYRDVLIDFKETKKTLELERALLLRPEDLAVNTNKKAITEILEVYTYHVLVDVFGDIPYSEALDIANPLPGYDDDTQIYADLFVKLDASIASLVSGSDSFGSGDFMYSGNVIAWKKFANSLKLRMALRTLDSGKITEAVAGGVFESNADNATFMYTNSHPYSNPLWENLVRSNRNDLLVSDTFVTVISPLNDPRAGIYMGDNKTPYAGGPYGANNSYNSYTHLGTVFHKADSEGLIMDYAEVEFLLAEAAARTLGGVTDAETHYKNGITASIKYWTGSDADAAVYIAQTTVAYDAVNYMKSIGTQKWLALYSNGFEGWSSWRVFGYPILTVPADADAAAAGMVPVRYTYPADEEQRNGVNYTAASSAIGGDKLNTRVFWNQ
jgi:hypothetical protein